ncbi:10822_t:CDS:2, partial [Paraglomus occultum]
MLCLEEAPLKGPINATKYVCSVYHDNAIMYMLSGYAIYTLSDYARGEASSLHVLSVTEKSLVTTSVTTLVT